eukprot:scaffold4845_cov62-Phaeocystis_antarctica.AAC.4
MNHKSSEVTQDQTSPRTVPILSSANLRVYSTRELSLLFLLLVLFTRLALALVYSSRELSLPLLVLMLCTVLAIALVYSPIKLPLPLLLLVLATLLALALVLFFALRSLSLLTLSEQVELLKLGADLAWRQLRPNPLFHTGWHASCILVVVSCASNGCPQWMPSLVRDSPLADSLRGGGVVRDDARISQPAPLRVRGCQPLINRGDRLQHCRAHARLLERVQPALERFVRMPLGGFSVVHQLVQSNVGHHRSRRPGA